MYYLDANTFIEAKNRYYHMDICPGYWQWILDSYADGSVGSIEMVLDELSKGNDELASWAKENESLFFPTDAQDVQGVMTDVSSYVASLPDLKPNAVPDFLSGADPWLVCMAKANGGVVVTHELPNPDAKKKIFLPDVCDYFDVQYINTFELLLKKEAQFVLS
ncbi:DUF4411 family protein [Marinobacter adhaerens]|jgi:hypothetical protein|uniref:DUF4411 family protein n=1 Tax=Marinobacter adhaerens TaxID=1033846 RepID=UPI003BABED1C